MTEPKNEFGVLADAIEVLFESIKKFAGDDEIRTRSCVVATGVLFFRLVDDMVNDKDKESFISNVFNISRDVEKEIEETDASEQSDTEASKDHGSPGEGPEERS